MKQSNNKQGNDTRYKAVEWWNGLEYPQHKLLLNKYNVANDFLDSDIETMYLGEQVQFNVCDRVLDLSDIEGEVIESPFAPALIRVAFGKGGSVWRDLKPHQLRKVIPTEQPESHFTNLKNELLDKKLQPEPENKNPDVSVENFTGGEWKIENTLDQSIFITSGETNIAYLQNDEDTGMTDEMEANAKRIVMCHNNFDEIVGALKELVDEMAEKMIAVNPYFYKGYKAAKSLIERISNK